ncbi:hypothetical protein [Promicromonospora sp. MEB111]|uniref:hypothetical protein n=1 Tax=Promicromonospora sp. MEB111 TaxID=3040301 RepID=UPI00254A8594|nr:hypothetical protein [Promicromonospora sp. MEB111]
MPAEDEPHEARHIRRWGDPHEGTPESRLLDSLRADLRELRDLAADLRKAVRWLANKLSGRREA